MGAGALPLVVRPLRGESPLSMLMRLAEANGCSVGTIQRDIGGALNDNAAHWNALARRLALNPTALEPLMQAKAGIRTARAAVTFLGHAIRPQFIVKDRVRICPSCIGERGFLKDVWRLVHCVACSDHRTTLIDTCRCGRPFNPTTHGPLAFTCPCGLDMADNEAPPATTDAVKGADWLLQAFGGVATSRAPRLWLIKGGRLNVPFSTMEPHDVMCVIDIVGQAATVPAHEDEKRTSSTRWTAGSLAGRRDLAGATTQVEAAMAVLHDWPASYDRLLDQVAGRNDEAGTRTRSMLFATRVGQYMLTPYRGLDGKPIEPLQSAVDGFLERRGYRLRRKVPLRTSTTAAAIHRVMPCLEVERRIHAGGSSEMIARLYRDTVHAFDARDDAWEDADELGNAVLREIRRRIAEGNEQISPGEAARIIGHASMETRPEIWIRTGLLRTVEPDTVVSAKIKKVAFIRAEVEAMRARIEALPRRVGPDEVPDGHQPFSLASKRSVGDEYTGADLLADMLDGTVGTVATMDRPGLSDLLVDADAARIRSLSRRIARIVEADQFAVTGRCEKILATLWPARTERLDIAGNRRLRESGAIRFRDAVNTTEDRTRPLYWYSLVDHMARAHALFGPSVSPEVDAMLAEWQQVETATSPT